MASQRNELNAWGLLNDAADELDRLRAEVEALRAWIEEEGRRTDTCTQNILGTVCEDCRCGKATPNAAGKAPAVGAVY